MEFVGIVEFPLGDLNLSRREVEFLVRHDFLGLVWGLVEELGWGLVGGLG